MTVAELLRLILLVFTAVSFIVLGDTAGKLLTSNDVSPYIVALTRFGLAALVFLPFSGLTRSEIPDLFKGRIVLRALFISAGVSCILTALKTEPIANVFGAFFIGPIVSYVLAVIFLGEKPSRLRSVFLAVGFVGVMLVVKPGFGATPGIFFALAAGCFYGAFLAITRTVASEFRSRFLLLSQLMVGSAFLTPMALTASLPPLDIYLSVLIVVSALASAIGNYMLVVANRTAEASLIAPLVYTQLISATIAGVVVFGDWPDTIALAGLVLIAISGIGSLFTNRLNKPIYDSAPDT